MLICDQHNGVHGSYMYWFWDAEFSRPQWNKADITMFTAKQSSVLNEDVYASVRDVLNKKLGDRVLTLTSEIKI